MRDLRRGALFGRWRRPLGLCAARPHIASGLALHALLRRSRGLGGVLCRRRGVARRGRWALARRLLFPLRLFAAMDSFCKTVARALLDAADKVDGAFFGLLYGLCFGRGFGGAAGVAASCSLYKLLLELDGHGAPHILSDLLAALALALDPVVAFTFPYVSRGVRLLRCQKYVSR